MRIRGFGPRGLRAASRRRSRPASSARSSDEIDLRLELAADFAPAAAGRGAIFGEAADLAAAAPLDGDGCASGVAGGAGFASGAGDNEGFASGAAVGEGCASGADAAAGKGGGFDATGRAGAGAAAAAGLAAS